MAKCEFLENCAFFNNFQKSDDPVKRGWTRLYCEGDSTECRRKIFRREHNAAPPPNMTPLGDLL